MIRKGFWIGTGSGVVLGLYMWGVERLSGEKVYTLLMNVDFIPVLGRIEWSVFMEWLFHLVISWMIGILYVFLINHTPRKQWLLAFGLSLAAAASYVPLTLLAIKDTPALTDDSAIAYWLVGHAIYGIVLKKM